LPAAILRRPKVGFRVPVNEWFRGRMLSYLEDQLLGAASLCRELLCRPELERYLDEHRRGAQNHEKLLWCLLNLEVWSRRCLKAPQAVTA
jgi:asparagine synthase (glutamine-hydrolysing)